MILVEAAVIRAGAVCHCRQSIVDHRRPVVRRVQCASLLAQFATAWGIPYTRTRHGVVDTVETKPGNAQANVAEPR